MCTVFKAICKFELHIALNEFMFKILKKFIKTFLRQELWKVVFAFSGSF